MASTIPTHFKFKLLHLQQRELSKTQNEVFAVGTRAKSPASFFLTFCHRRHFILKPEPCSGRLAFSRACSDGGGALDATPQTASDVDSVKSTSSSSVDGYVPLFVRMLGLDNSPLDREQSIVALWKYSKGGKQCIDAIMQFRGCINLIVNLLKTESTATCEAAAGLLRTVSSVNQYRDSVAESGAIEEIEGLLSQPSLAAEVKEQSICVLWNLSVDEHLRVKIANSDLLPTLIKSLDDEEIKVKEAAGGVLSNLALCHCNHKIMVEAGVIPKLANVLKTDIEGSKVIRKVARNALLELAKDEYYRILIIEEGLTLVPIIGTDAYKSLRSFSHSWPSLPDGTEFKRTSSGPSRYGASELLLGLNIQDKNINLEEAKMKAIVGRTQQQFLARIGAIELEDGKWPQSESSTDWHYTILPWMDGVARLVLILELEDASAISRAAQSIADASINEHMRISFKEAGAVKHLVRFLYHDNEAVRFAASHALERLSVSNVVCQIIEAEGVVWPLVNALKSTEISENLLEKNINLLARVLDPGKEMKSKFYGGPINGSTQALNAMKNPVVTKGLVGSTDDILVSQSTAREDILDYVVLSRLVDILKASSPSLQRKAASILEYIAITKPCIDKIIAAGIESGLDSVFRQMISDDLEDEIDSPQPELNVLEAEETGLAVSAASRLLTKLLDFEQFQKTINSAHFTRLLRKVLKSDIPLHNKDWVAACIVKLGSSSGSSIDLENSINMEVLLYETIPRLVEQIMTSFAPEAQEAAVIELNKIISEGDLDCTRAVAAKGGIFPLVKVMEEGSEKAVEAGLTILYNLSMDAENHAAIIAAGAVPILRRIVYSQGPQWMRALHLLRTLPTQ